MTVTSPASGARMPRRRPTRRLVATGAALLLVLGLAAPASGATPSSTPSPGTGATEAARELEVSPAANGVVRAGQPLTLSLALQNGVAPTTTDTRVAVSVGAAPLAGRAALDAWLDDPAAIDPSAQNVADATLPVTGPASESLATVSLAPDDPLLAGRAPGVYTVRAEAAVEGDTLTARSVIVVPDDAATASVGVLVPITAGPLQAGLLTADELTELTASDGALTAQLAAVAGTGAILAVDPAIVAAIRVLGSSAPASATAWLERLEDLPNARFALQFGDADVATQLHAGVPTPLEPTSLQAYMDAADFAPTAVETPETPEPTASPSASPTVAPGGPVFPTLDELTDVGGRPRADTFWPATGSAGAEVVTSLGASGTADAPSLTLVPSATTSAGAGGATVGASATAHGAAMLVYDSAISSRLNEATTAADPEERAGSLAAATAHLAFAAAEDADRPLLVTVDRAGERSRADLRAAITAASLAPGVEAASLSELADAAPEPVDIAEASAADSRVAETRLLLSEEVEIDRFSSILDDPRLLTGPQRAEILQLLGVAWLDDAAGAGNAFAAHRAATAATLDSVGILSTNVVLGSSSAAWRPYVRNDLPWPVTVDLVARPDSPRLLVQERTPVTAQPASNTRVEIPIEARIGNGNVAVSMQLYSPTGIDIGSVNSASIEVHAEWETIGLVILGALMVLFIGLGVARTIWRRRARARELEAVRELEGPA